MDQISDDEIDLPQPNPLPLLYSDSESDQEGGNNVIVQITGPEAKEDSSKVFSEHSELLEQEFIGMIMKQNGVKFKSQLKPSEIYKVFVNLGSDV